MASIFQSFEGYYYLRNVGNYTPNGKSLHHKDLNRQTEYSFVLFQGRAKGDGGVLKPGSPPPNKLGRLDLVIKLGET